MPERSSPAQPNYLRFVSTPTIDIEPKFCKKLDSIYIYILKEIVLRPDDNVVK